MKVNYIKVLKIISFFFCRTDFSIYAETCFKEFGDRVKHWITFNEPHTFAIQGYDVGLQAPGRCSILLHLFCRGGNSATEPYIVAHNVLLSHAAVADIYRKKYKVLETIYSWFFSLIFTKTTKFLISMANMQATQKGSLGIAFDVIWFEPMSNSQDDIDATQRAQDFQLGWWAYIMISSVTYMHINAHLFTYKRWTRSWIQLHYRFMDPLFFGDYPSSMRTRVGNRLPKFTRSEVALVKGSLDFVGINHYTTFYATKDSTNIIGILLNDTLADSGAITLRKFINLKKREYIR